VLLVIDANCTSIYTYLYNSELQHVQVNARICKAGEPRAYDLKNPTTEAVQSQKHTIKPAFRIRVEDAEPPPVSTGVSSCAGRD
jgi:hypothetical protein